MVFSGRGRCQCDLLRQQPGLSRAAGFQHLCLPEHPQPSRSPSSKRATTPQFPRTCSSLGWEGPPGSPQKTV